MSYRLHVTEELEFEKGEEPFAKLVLKIRKEEGERRKKRRKGAEEHDENEREEEKENQ